MEITGKVVKLLDLQTGTGKNGDWRKQEYIIEIPGKYPKQVCCNAWGDIIDEIGLQVGDEVKASIDIQSREYNGRWYTDVKIWKAEKGGAQVDEDRNSYIDAAPHTEDDLPF